MRSASRNSVRLRPVSFGKRVLVRGGRQPRRIPLGLYRGIRLDLDLAHQTQIYLGLYERETFRLIRRAGKTARWVVDVGAGQGDLSIWFLLRSACDTVHAFEPDAEEVERFRSNLALNDLQQDGRLTIHASFVGTGDGAAVAALDSLPLDLTAPGFLKIDVDGYEAEVLAGAGRLLSDGKPDILIEVHSQELEQECRKVLETHAYRVQVVDNAWWRAIVPEDRPIPHNRWLWASKAPSRP